MRGQTDYKPADRSGTRSRVVPLVVGAVVGVVIGATIVGPKILPNADQETMAPDSNANTQPDETEAGNRPTVRWKMASVYPAELPLLGALARRVDQQIWRVSDGQMEIKFHGPGSLAPTSQVLDAVAKGRIDAVFSSPARLADRNPALSLFSSVPFGPRTTEYLAWINFGGGKKLYEDFYHKLGLHGVFCGAMPAEASGMFRKEIRTVDDFRGLRIRTEGLSAKVLRKLGAETVSLSGGDISNALELGSIDAVVYSLPSVDLKMGFYRQAKQYYLPGWQAPSTLYDLVFNLDKWEALDPIHQAQVESVCGDNIRYGLAEAAASQYEALKEMGVNGADIHRWPATILEKIQEAWQRVVIEQARANPDFGRVWDSLTAFRKDYAVWRELAYP